MHFSFFSIYFGQTMQRRYDLRGFLKIYSTACEMYLRDTLKSLNFLSGTLK